MFNGAWHRKEQQCPKSDCVHDIFVKTAAPRMAPFAMDGEGGPGREGQRYSLCLTARRRMGKVEKPTQMFIVVPNQIARGGTAEMGLHAGVWFSREIEAE